MTENEALQITKYKLSVVCLDSAIMKDFPAVAELALATIAEIDRKIVSSAPITEVPILTATKDDTNKHKPTRGRVQRTVFPIR